MANSSRYGDIIFYSYAQERKREHPEHSTGQARTLRSAVYSGFPFFLSLNGSRGRVRREEQISRGPKRGHPEYSRLTRPDRAARRNILDVPFSPPHAIQPADGVGVRRGSTRWPVGDHPRETAAPATSRAAWQRSMAWEAPWGSGPTFNGRPAAAIIRSAAPP